MERVEQVIPLVFVLEIMTVLKKYDQGEYGNYEEAVPDALMTLSKK